MAADAVSSLRNKCEEEAKAAPVVGPSFSSLVMVRRRRPSNWGLQPLSSSLLPPPFLTAETAVVVVAALELAKSAVASETAVVAEAEEEFASSAFSVSESTVVAVDSEVVFSASVVVAVFSVSEEFAS